MNRRDFLKFLPFIGVLATAIFKPKSPRAEVITADDLEDKRTETTWKVVNLGQPVINTITWNNRIYAVGANGDIWMSDDHFATWVKVEAIDSSVPHRYYPRPNRFTY